MTGYLPSLQSVFMNFLRKNKTQVILFLVKGIKIQGTITNFDNFSILLRYNGKHKFIYKHSISTIMLPLSYNNDVMLSDLETMQNKVILQDMFLDAVCKSKEKIMMFLMNGVMLQGNIIAFDKFCILFQRSQQIQLVYKHAISTLQPDNPISLADENTSAVE